MPDLFAPSLTDQRICADRELAFRRRVYARWVADGRMTQKKADHEIRTMEAIRDTLARLVEEEKRNG